MPFVRVYEMPVKLRYFKRLWGTFTENSNEATSGFPSVSETRNIEIEQRHGH
jgi:hypothetical protein